MKAVKKAFTIFFSGPLETEKEQEVYWKGNGVFQPIPNFFSCNPHCNSIRNSDPARE